MTEGAFIAPGAALLLLALWVWSSAPGRGRSRARAWAGTPFAHRGLHGPGRPENSLAAFEHACEMGYGIELDVLATGDGHLVVFHDDDALRMAGDARLIRDMTLAEVRALRLLGGDSRIPTFDEALEAVRGRVPLLVEVKGEPGVRELTRKVAERLSRYEGGYVVESFHPLSLHWLRKHAPGIVRGQLIKGYRDYRETLGPIPAFLLSCAIPNALSRPDFVAYSREMRKSPAIWLQRRVFKTPLAVWTISDRAEMDGLIRRGEMPIFERIHE